MSKLENAVGEIPALIARHLAGKIDLVRMELTFDQWFEVYNLSPSGSKLRQLALTKMSELAQTFDQWLEVYNLSPSGNKLEQLALKRMAELEDESKE